jgi:hypothetical protein
MPPLCFSGQLTASHMSKRKLNRGQAITEVKGSLDDYLQRLRNAFYSAFPDAERGPIYVVREIFSDHLIVSVYTRTSESIGSALQDGEYYRVGYSVAETGAGIEFAFDAQDQWEVVELAYQPAAPAKIPQTTPAPTVVTERAKGRKARFTEQVDVIKADLGEAVKTAQGEGRRIRVREAVMADAVNRNRRRYPREVVRGAVTEIRQHLHESAGQGRAILLTKDGDQLVGEADHPSDKGQRPLYLETIVNWTEVTFDEGTGAVDFIGTVIPTSKGKDALTLMEFGVMPGGSLRGYGFARTLTENDGEIEEVTELHFTGYDLVMTPGFLNHTVLESKNDKNEFDQEDNMDPKKLLEMLQQNPELAAQVKAALGIEALDKLTEAQAKQIEGLLREKLNLAPNADVFKTIAEAMDAKRTLDEQARKAAIAEAVKKACEKLPYGESLNKQFADELAEAVTDAAGVQAAFERLQKRYDAMVASARLAGMGMSAAGGAAGVQVLGTVLERDAGVPEYGRVSHELLEGLRAREYAPIWNEAKPKNRNQIVAAQILKRFDEQFKDKLAAEAQRFNEAQLSTDLSLPYSVSRAVVAAVWPQLVATSIFDVAPMQNSPDLLYFETYTEESGMSVTITDEAVTAPNPLAQWRSLANQRVKQGTVVLTNSAGSTTYVENTDYFVDYGNGRIFVPTGGAITAGQSLLIDYVYEAIRKGENAPIERAKTTLSNVTITAKADRMSIDITNEAVEFSRSQLNYDVVQRTLGNLITEQTRKVDQDIFSMAAATLRTVANNSGGTWNGSAGSPDYADAILKLGKAKVKVLNRNYSPTSIVVSVANADLLANWSGFTESGSRPDAEAQSNGFFRTLKGLPIYAAPSTALSDNIMMVVNRELVAFRVYKPLSLQGPFPKYDQATAKLIAATQWYIEEYNAMESPVAGKGSFVAVT